MKIMQQPIINAGQPRRRTQTIGRSLIVASTLAAIVVLAFLAGTALRSGGEALTGASGQSGAARPAFTTSEQIDSLQTRLAKRPDDTRSAIDLAGLYLQQARETGDPTWYVKAETLLGGVLEREPNNAEALAWMGALDLSRHEFSAALAWGLKAKALQPDLLATFPVLIDAYVELGRYDEAVAATDEFIRLRPDVRSYTRVAYLRELHGDRAGAIEAMLLALDTVREGSEAGAWTRVQLGNLYFNGGDLDAAEREYRRTLRALPDYAPAQAALARVVLARGDDQQAIDLLERASTRLPLPEYVIALGDVYSAAGKPQAAAEQYALVDAMTRLQQTNGVNTDLELALFAADHPTPGTTPEQVVAQAQAALERRPSIYAHDVLAWALYRARDYAAAQAEIDQALRLGTRDALLHFHAGMIAKARGDLDAARTHLATALAINPHFSILHAAEARAALAELGG
jgi:tetratricopeptide (TPR) repeat protein